MRYKKVSRGFYVVGNGDQWAIVRGANRKWVVLDNRDPERAGKPRSFYVYEQTEFETRDQAYEALDFYGELDN